MATKAKSVSTSTVSVIAFPKCKTELLPRAEITSSIIIAAEAGKAVNKLENNWFGQLLAYGQKAVTDAGKAASSYDEASKIVGEVIDTVKKDVMAEFDTRMVALNKDTSLSDDDRNEKKSHVAELRAKVDNSLKSAKSVITGAIRDGSTILKVLAERKDTGHILFRASGDPRGKTELQTLLKDAKEYARPERSPLELAMQAGLTLARRMADLTDAERKLVMDALKKKLKELDDLADEITVADEDDGTDLAEAA